jgi:hypothetical protein
MRRESVVEPSLDEILSPLWGLSLIFSEYPRLAPWAAFFRRFAAYSIYNSSRQLAIEKVFWLRTIRFLSL